jgi:hypothetical protein
MWTGLTLLLTIGGLLGIPAHPLLGSVAIVLAYPCALRAYSSDDMDALMGAILMLAAAFGLLGMVT